MEKSLYWIKGVLAVIGTFVVTAIGGVDSIMVLLIQLIIFDIITGVIKALVKKQLASRTMFYGIIRKMLIFVIIVIAVQVDKVVLEVVKTPMQIMNHDIYIRTLFIIYFALEEFLSLLENLCDIGVPFPKWLKGLLKQVESTVSGETTPTVIVNWLKQMFNIDVKDKKDSDKKEKEEPKAIEEAVDKNLE